MIIKLIQGMKTKLKIENAKVIIMEGIFALHKQKIRDLLSIKIYVDTPSDIRLLRRIKRDMNDRGRTIEGIIEQYNKTVKPMFTNMSNLQEIMQI